MINRYIFSLLLASSLANANNSAPVGNTNNINPDMLIPPDLIKKSEVERVNKEKAPTMEGKQLNPPQDKKEDVKVIKKTIYKIKDEELQRKMDVIYGEPIKKENQQNNSNNNIAGYNTINEGVVSKEIKRIESGICDLGSEVELSIEERFVDATCIIYTDPTNRIQRARIVLQPVVNEYQVTGYIESVNGDTNVKTLRILSPDRTTKNLAKEVDKNTISNIILLASRQTGKDVSDITRNIFRQGAQQQTTYNINTGVANVDTTAERLKQVPKASLYLALANLIGATSSELMSNRDRIPPLFKVYRTVYVEYERNIKQ